jgi:hypothetical protein
MEWPYRQTEMNLRLQFSRSGKYLTTGSRIWGVDHGDLVWTCPSRSHASWPDRDYRAAEFVQDERHIIIQLD